MRDGRERTNTAVGSDWKGYLSHSMPLADRHSTTDRKWSKGERESSGETGRRGGSQWLTELTRSVEFTGLIWNPVVRRVRECE